MNKKEYLILGSIGICTLVGSSIVKNEALFLVLIMLLAFFLVLFLIQKNWILQLTKVLLVLYVFMVVFLASDELLYYLFPKQPQLEPTQNIGGVITLIGLGLALVLTVFFAWDIRKNGERKTVLIYRRHNIVFVSYGINEFYKTLNSFN